jgi:threonine/homoserine/homoserine lactone efflux protein
MFHVPPILVAGLTGLVFGFLLSVPVGPINLTIMNEGARRGFNWASLIGFGAVVMEVIYCAIAFTSFASFVDRGYVKVAMELFSLAFMLFLGIKFLLARSIPATSKIEERIEQKLHPHSAFMTGFVRVMGNPGVLVFWVFLAANFILWGWVGRDLLSKLSCITGVAVGTSIWFLGLSWAVSLRHKKFDERTLLRMEHFSGLGLLLLAFFHGLHIVWQMAHRGQ